MPRRRIVVTALLPPPEPEPEYPLYQQIRVGAEHRGRGPLGPADLKLMYEVASRRGGNWCTAVLGRDFPGIDYVSSVDGFTLIAADELALDPPLPTRIVEQRKRTQEANEAREQKFRELREKEKRRWEAALAAAGVEMTVRENTRHSSVRGSLRHAVPKDELVSGRSRKHLADRGLCETPDRLSPLHLGDPVNAPANCHRCLSYMEQVRTLDAPAPPTPGERKLLQLINSGAVFTLQPGRGSRTIRDTSERSHGVAWGQLGRKVDASVRKLEKKGWVVQDHEHSRTLLGHLGDRWRLTNAGTAVLEGRS
ncbi:hypothetical protein ACWD7T_35225 [Streptomyces sp. 900116325]